MLTPPEPITDEVASAEVLPNANSVAETAASVCTSCGSRAEAGSEFCGECGARLEPETATAPASQHIETETDFQPEDVWAPEAPTMAAATAVPEAPALAPPAQKSPTAADRKIAAPPPPDHTPTTDKDRRRRRLLLAGLAVLVVGGGGTAAALALTSGSSDKKVVLPQTVTVRTPPRTVTQQQVLTQTETASLTPSVTATSGVVSTPATAYGLLPPESTTQMTREIQALLLQYHQLIVARQPATAWQLLSTRKQDQELVKDGYRNWAAAQESLAPHLDPSGLQVQMLSQDAATGIVTVEVTGMKWSAPHARCTEWSGITWVKYENGTWKYDPGIETTAARKREWKSRYSQLLGAQCI